MQIIFTEHAIKQLQFFMKSGNKAVLAKIAELIQAIQESPYAGIGKPEQLKYELQGLWSGRINQEHRLIYEVTEESILVLSLKGHYEAH